MNLKNKKSLGYILGAIAILLIIIGVWSNESKKIQAEITADLVDSYFEDGILGIRFGSLASEYKDILEYSRKSETRDIFHYKRIDKVNFLGEFNNDTHEFASNAVFYFDGIDKETATMSGYGEFCLFADANAFLKIAKENWGDPTATYKKDKTTIFEWRGSKKAIALITTTGKYSGMENAGIRFVITKYEEES